jgi:hypothetical protein
MDAEEQLKEQQKHQFHQSNLRNEADKGESVAVLRALSEIDDLPIDPETDPIMGQLASTLTSTANLSAEQVRSNEWVREYLMVLYLCRYPREEGLHGHRRGWVHGDREEAVDPIDAKTRMTVETFVTSTKLALSRSEQFKAVEESTRSVSESVVHDDGSDSSGGILGRLRS